MVSKIKAGGFDWLKRLMSVFNGNLPFENNTANKTKHLKWSIIF